MLGTVLDPGQPLKHPGAPDTKGIRKQTQLQVQ